MGRSENEAARRWYQPEREKLFIQPAVASRPAMIPHMYNETSSQPVNDLGGVPAVYDSFGKASAPWGYVAGSPSSRHTPRRGFAWQMQAFVHARLPMADLLRRPQPVVCPGPAMGQPGVRGKYGKTIMITSAGIRRIAVRLMLAFQARCRICNIIMEAIGIQMHKN